MCVQHRKTGAKHPVGRVLAADDCEINQEVLQSFLNKLGCETTIVANGVLVLEIMEKERFDLLLLDLEMPQLDGISTAQIIRDSGSRVLDHHIPIVVVTAHPIDLHFDDYQRRGIDDFIIKPITLPNLEEILTRYLKHKRTTSVPLSAPSGTVSDLPFDREGLLAGLEHDMDLFQQLLDTFLTQGPSLMGQLEAVINSGQIEEISAVAHRIRGALTTLKAHPAAQIAQQIENASVENNWEQVIQNASLLKKNFAQLVAHLSENGSLGAHASRSSSNPNMMS